jgi:[CysO sulfur-carrier protein]-S-L-cysteine hydrolase
VKLSHAQLEQMIAQARADAPLETCGLLAGRDGRATHVLPVPNVLRSRVRYSMGGGQAFFDAMAACDFEPLAIYHSHPHGPPVPSPTDIAESFYPDAIYIILSLAQEPPSVRAFRIVDGVVTEETCEVSGTSQV